MSDSEFASKVYALRLEDWMGASMTALPIFEFVTTLDQEVTSVWKRRQSGASLLLCAVRYTMLVTAIVNIVTFAPMNTKECLGISIFADFWGLLGVTLTAAFSALRIYALCDGSVRLSAAVLLLQLSPFAVNMYRYVESTCTVDPLLGCLSVTKYESQMEQILILVSRIPLSIGDVFVVIVTWTKSFQQMRMQHNIGVHLPLSTLLFRDGTVYFLVLLVLNVLEIMPLTSYRGGIIIAYLNGSLPLILANRFMLNLRQLSDSEARSSGHIRTISIPMFQTSFDIAGNMGEPLEHAWGARDIDEPEVEEVARSTENAESEVNEAEGTEFENEEVPLEAGPSRLQMV